MPGFSCCVPRCYNNNKKHRHLKFYNFPKDEQLRKIWIAKIKRQGTNGKFSIFKPTTGHRVCSEHFVGGIKTYTNNIPTVFSWNRDDAKPNRRILVRNQLPSTPPRQYDTSHSILNDHSYAIHSTNTADLAKTIKEKDEIIHQLQLKVEQLEREIEKNEKEAEFTRKCADDLKTKLAQLEERFCNQKNDLQQAHKELTDKTFSVTSLRDKPDKFKFYTGCSHSEFLTLYDLLSPDVPHLINWGSTPLKETEEGNIKRARNHKLTTEDRLLMVLMRIRVGLLEEDLAYRFGIHHTTVSRICRTYYDLMATRFRQVPIWPSKSLVQREMPECFRHEYPTTRVILDCTELFIETPSHFRVQAETYSSYKNHNTAKGLIGISPNGFISFVSDLVPGRMSDKEITINSGLIDHLSEGDSVMADRGFVIDEYLAKKSVHLNIPPFMTGRQLSPSQERETRRIARVRIHVERAIERIKNYRILNFTFPNSMANDLNKIWVICCYLVNFTTNPIASDKNSTNSKGS